MGANQTWPAPDSCGEDSASNWQSFGLCVWSPILSVWKEKQPKARYLWNPRQGPNGEVGGHGPEEGRPEGEGVREEACGWTLGAAPRGEVSGPHTDSETHSGVLCPWSKRSVRPQQCRQGPAGQVRLIIPQTSVSSSRGALVPLPESGPRNVTLFGDRVLTEETKLKEPLRVDPGLI